LRLSLIDFENLVDVNSESRWGRGSKFDRLLYRDEKYWYKVWGKDFLPSSPYVSSGKFHGHYPQLKEPHGFQVGLFTPLNSSAFHSFLYDDDDNVRGYVSVAGDPVRSEDLTMTFVEDFFQQCIDSGWLYSDFCFPNLVKIGGKISLIDFDTHLTDIRNFDREFEIALGALRPHIEDNFRKLIESLLGI